MRRHLGVGNCRKLYPPLGLKGEGEKTVSSNLGGNWSHRREPICQGVQGGQKGQPSSNTFGMG